MTSSTLLACWIGAVLLSASASSSSTCFLSFSDSVLSAVTCSISFLIASGGCRNALVCGSMPLSTMETLAATSSYSAKSLKPYFLATASRSAWILASGFSAAEPSILSAMAVSSFWAAM